MKNTLALALMSGLSYVIAPVAQADSFTLYFMPSPGMNWKNPSTLARSVLNNQLKKSAHPIGHVVIHVSCGGSDLLPPEEFYTGMTNADRGEDRRMLLDEKIGFGILFHGFKGRMEDSEAKKREIARYIQDPKLGMSFLKFEIAPATCRRLATYRNEFRERGYDQVYGLPQRPRYGEGAGCTAYGASFVELAGVMSPEYHANWTRHLGIPNRVIGGKLTGTKVPFASLLVKKKAYEWYNPADSRHPPGHSIYFWDADLMHAWVQGTWNREIQKLGTPYRFERLNHVKGLILDKTQVPTPTDPIFLN